MSLTEFVDAMADPCPEKHKKTKKGTETMTATGLGSAVRMRDDFSRRDNKGENGEKTHKETRNLKKAQQETAQTTLVVGLDFLQSGRSALHLYK